jgi:hypothetical protein
VPVAPLAIGAGPVEDAMMVLLLATAAAIQATPTPTPTPMPGFSLGVLRAEPNTPPPKGSSLGEVARSIKLRLPPGEKSLTITNSNLPELSEGVVLTSGAGTSLSPSGLGEGNEQSQRLGWQNRYQQARGYASFLQDRLANLQAEVGRLERQFYAEDDPAYRDGVIKPAWDKALADIKKTQEELEKARSLPDQVRNEAMQHGAAPGWFRGLPEPQPSEAPPVGAAPPGVAPPTPPPGKPSELKPPS